MQTHAHLISHIAYERIHDELAKVFKKSNPFWYIALLHELQALWEIFPSLSETIGNHQPIRYHPFDTFNHTLLTLHALQDRLKEKEINETEKMLAHLAMLYHDIGKPEQYKKMEIELTKNPENPDRSAYEHHTDIWAQIAKKEFKKLCFPKKQIETISRYIKHHHRPGEILDWAEKKKKKRLRTLISEWWILQTTLLLEIAIADRLWQLNPLQKPAIQWLISLQELASEIFESEWRFTKDQLAIDGKKVMREFNLQSGPIIWTYIEKAFERVLWDVNERNDKTKILTHLQSLNI